jgi:hypothetical protein
MSSTLLPPTRKKVLALRAERLQKEVELLQTQEDLANLEEDSLSTDQSPPPFLTFSSSNPSFGSLSSMEGAQNLSDHMIQAGITKKFADGRVEFYEKDLEKAKESTLPGRDSWMATTISKLDKHRNSSRLQTSIIADCIKRMGSLAVPSTIPSAGADFSFSPLIDQKPVYDGHSG